MDLKNYKPYKPYKPIFEKTVKKLTIKESIESLKAMKQRLAKMKEEDSKDIDAVIDELDKVVTDAIDDLGAGSSVVDSLVDTAQELEIASDLADDEEEIIVESSEDETREVENDVEAIADTEENQKDNKGVGAD